MERIACDIAYIGVDDTDIDLFENQYRVPDGISYNSYLILDDKVAVMDTVDRRKGKEWMAALLSALDGRTPDYLIVSHLEPDHAYNVAEAARRFPSMTIVSSQKSFSMMPQFFGTDFSDRRLVVSEGAELCLGRRTLKFVMAPMVHWPEVMVSYETSEGILFSADAFGRFGALSKKTDDWDTEARRYFINICGKYGMPVQTLLKKAAKLDIRTICPLHGPVLSGDLSHYFGLYLKWSNYLPESDGALVAYASIHGNTAEAACRMADILRSKGVEDVRVMDLCRCDMSEAMAEAFRLKYMVVAAPTYDTAIFPPMEDFLRHLKLKAYQNRRVALIENGSWAPTAGKLMGNILSEMKDIAVIQPIVTVRSVMRDADVQDMMRLADSLIGE